MSKCKNLVWNYFTKEESVRVLPSKTLSQTLDLEKKLWTNFLLPLASLSHLVFKVIQRDDITQRLKFVCRYCAYNYIRIRIQLNVKQLYLSNI